MYNILRIFVCVRTCFAIFFGSQSNCVILYSDENLLQHVYNTQFCVAKSSYSHSRNVRKLKTRTVLAYKSNVEATIIRKPYRYLPNLYRSVLLLRRTDTTVRISGSFRPPEIFWTRASVRNYKYEIYVCT